MKAIVVLAALGEAAFVGFIAAAMARYPGGTSWDPTSVGHSFFGNFFSDLLRAHGRNGQPNPGAPQAAIGMAGFIVTLAAVWWLLGFLVKEQPRAASWLRAFGLLSTVATAAVPLSPSDRFPLTHTLATLTAAIAALLATVVSIAALWRAGHRLLAWWGTAALAPAIVNTVLYADHCLSGRPVTLLLPAVQKVGAILAATWFVGLLAGAWTAAGRKAVPETAG